MVSKNKLSEHFMTSFDSCYLCENIQDILNQMKRYSIATLTCCEQYTYDKMAVATL